MSSLWEVLKTSKGLPAPDGFTALFARSLSDTYTLAEISGIPPLNLGEIVEIVDYTIEGNTYQSDGVTPDTPQEVVGVGERTGNLFDISEENWKKQNATISVEVNENKVTISGVWFAYVIVPVKPNTTYVLQYICESYTIKNRVGIYGVINGVYNNDDAIVTGIVSGKSFDSGDRTEIAIMFYASDISGTNGISVYSNIQLEAGSTATEYELYGYKADVVTRGKNLWYLQSSYSFTTYYDINVNINAGHYLSYIIETNGTTDVQGGTGCQLTFSDNTTQYVFFNTTYRKSILLSKDVKIVRVYAGKDYNTSVGFTATVSEIMVSANADDSYEPYTPPITTPIYTDFPLYKIGDYSDSRGMTEEVRVVKELILTGGEDWTYITGGKHWTPATMYQKSGLMCICSHYEAVANGSGSSFVVNGQVGFYSSAANRLIFCNTNYTTTEDWKSYLAEQYENGTPVTVYYVLAEPESKAVEPVEIPTLNGTTVIDVDTEVKPSHLKITYKSKM